MQNVSFETSRDYFKRIITEDFKQKRPIELKARQYEIFQHINNLKPSKEPIDATYIEQGNQLLSRITKLLQKPSSSNNTPILYDNVLFKD